MHRVSTGGQTSEGGMLACLGIAYRLRRLFARVLRWVPNSMVGRAAHSYQDKQNKTQKEKVIRNFCKGWMPCELFSFGFVGLQIIHNYFFMRNENVSFLLKNMTIIP